MRSPDTHVIPDSVVAKTAIALSIAAASPFIAIGTKHLIEKITETQTIQDLNIPVSQPNRDLESASPRNGDVPLAHNGVETVVYDLDALRNNAVI